MVGVRLAGWVLSVISLGAHAYPKDCDIVHTQLDSSRLYDSVIDGVDAMRSVHLGESVRSDREFVGAIVETADGYAATIGLGCAGRDTVTFTVPSGADVVAFWHTHGAPAANRDFFSADDVGLVRATRRDFYLITPRGDLKVLRAADVASRRAGAALWIDRPLGVTRASGTSVARTHRVDERIVRRGALLPSESRGAAPVG